MDRKTVRSMQELIDLQDKAIQALQQANQALQIALDILWKSRQELGHPEPMYPALVPNIFTPQLPNTWVTIPAIQGGIQGNGEYTVPTNTGLVNGTPSNVVNVNGSNTGPFPAITYDHNELKKFVEDWKELQATKKKAKKA